MSFLFFYSCSHYHQIITLHDEKNLAGTFWNKKSDLLNDRGSGLQIISSNQLREYYFKGDERFYDRYGGDIMIDTLFYSVHGDIFEIRPYYQWRILSYTSDSLVLIDTLEIPNTFTFRLDTIVYVRSKDQTTLPR